MIPAEDQKAPSVEAEQASSAVMALCQPIELCGDQATFDRLLELRGLIAALELAEFEFQRAMRANVAKAFPHVAQADRRRRLLNLYREEVFLLRRLDDLQREQTAAAVEVLTERDLP